MSSRFVSTWRCRPPMNVTLLVRSGGSVFDAYFSPWRGWFRTWGGGKEEAIPEPESWWADEEQAGAVINEPIVQPSRVPSIRRGQLLFDLSDRKTQSRRAA